MIPPKIIAGVVGFALAIGLIVSIQQSNNLLEKQQTADSDASREADTDRLRAEYQRIVLGCNTAGAMETQDLYLRELCDETIHEVRQDLIAAEAEE